MTTYFGLLTKVGEAKEANAKALGLPVKITELEVGDGGGALPIPSRDQTSLIGPKHRAPINRIFVDPNNPAWLVVEQVIPEQFGGWWARELGLRDAEGDLIAVANCPPTYKPQMAEGSARTQVVRMVLQVSSTGNFSLKIDPAVVLATRGYVDEEVAKRLGKDDTAAAAKKLATARKLSIAGAGTATAKDFDGQADVELQLTALDMSKATKGTLPVERGGTGLTTVAEGCLLLGTKDGKLRAVAPTDLPPGARYPLVYPLASLPTQNVGPVIVAELGATWIWIQTPEFTGYRSPDCGHIEYSASTQLNPGSLHADGAAISVSQFAGLAAKIFVGNAANASAAWGYRCDDPSAPSASRSVNGAYITLPDLRGEYIRGLDSGRGTDAGRALGSWQSSTEIPNAVTGAGGGSLTIRVTDGEHPRQYTLQQQIWTAGSASALTTYRGRVRNLAMFPVIKF
ncbi:phage tail protein [Achromobacter ruhlandii]|uniref:phage tail protein n=1 Tax=Achromobacter ruhlandii TaxID=72557 RepID=UPI003018320F